MAACNGHVFFFYHEQDLASSRQLRDHVANLCTARGWQFNPRPFSSLRDPRGRSIPLIAVDVASGLYRLCHRARVATLVLSSDPRVPLHPRTQDALTYSRHIPLKRFVAYKCCWYRVPNDASNDTWAGVFESWCKRVDCDNERDPRCLPFHVFKGEAEDLNTEEARRQFNHKYGAASDREDDTQTHWRLNPKTYHGQDALTIAGCALPAGAHWDVLPPSKRQFYTPSGAWDIEGHFNAYPDSHLRPGSGKFRKLA